MELVFSKFIKLTLCFSKSVLHRYFGILRKFGVFYYQLMELVSQKVRTLGASMTVIDTKKGASRPVGCFFEFRLDDVQDNRDSIFVVIPNNSLVSVSCIGDNDPILFRGIFSRLVSLCKTADGLI
jgi:hypothetical protein